MRRDIRSFFYNYLDILAGEGGKLALGALTFPLLVRLLGPEDYGSYTLFHTVIGMIGVFLGWNATAVVRFGKEEFMDSSRVTQTLWSNLIITWPIVALAAVAILVFGEELTTYIGIGAGLFYLIIGHVVSRNAIGSLPKFLQAMGRIRAFAYVPLVPLVAFLAALWLMAVGVFPRGVSSVITCNVAAVACGSVVGIALLRRQLLPWKISRSWTKRCLLYSYPMLFGALSQYLVQYADVIIIRMFLPLSYVGLYSVGYMLQDYLLAVPMMSTALMFPLMTSLVVSGKQDSIAEYVAKLVPQIVVFWSLILTAVALFAREIFHLFGPQYTEAVLPFTILIVGIAWRIFPIIDSPIMSSTGLIKEMVVLSIAMSAINVAGDFWLIPMLGITGAAVATTTAFLVGATARSAVLWRKFGLNLFPAYGWLTPVLVAVAASSLLSDPIHRFGVLLAIVSVILYMCRRRGVFHPDTVRVLELIDMPEALRSIACRVYQYLARGYE